MLTTLKKNILRIRASTTRFLIWVKIETLRSILIKEMFLYTSRTTLVSECQWRETYVI